MEGTRSASVPVISLTMSMTAIGTLPTPAKRATMPTMTKGAGKGIMPGTSELSTTQNAAPTNPPITRDGAKTPALPPDPTVNAVARILKTTISNRTASMGSAK